MDDFGGELGGADEGGAATGGDDVFIGAAGVDVDSLIAEVFEPGAHESEVLWGFAPNLGDDGLLAGEELEAFEGVLAAELVGVAINVGEFGEKDVGPAGLGDDLAKDKVGDALHGGEDREWRFELVPEHIVYYSTMKNPDT